jgi:hypothetical protein
MHTKMMRKIIITISLALLIGLALTALSPAIAEEYPIESVDIFEFDGLSGPDSVSTIKAAELAKWKDYKKGSASRLAILLTREDSAWLGLVHGLKTIGVPFRITTSVDEALKHKVVLVYPKVSRKLLSGTELKQIADYVRSGGNLIGIKVLGDGLQSIFGFKSVKSSRSHNRVELQDNHPAIHGLADEDSRTIRLSTEELDDLPFRTRSFVDPENAPLALYNDGTPAIIYNKFKKGEVYAIGFDIGFYLLKAYNGGMESVADEYINGFESSADNLLRLIKTIYERHEPRAVTLGTVPYNRSLSVILTHDIDYGRSMVNALAYAELERDSDTPATHFIQTKYIRDWNDKIFFDDDRVGYLKKLKALNAELASHSVSHSRTFNKFTLGTGREKYPDYTPFVKEKYLTYNGSVFGELRVSKFLIENFAPNTDVVSFRPGHLRAPRNFPEALEATGYRYSSTATANLSLSHLPFKLNHHRGHHSEVDVFEFPITVEDERLPKMGDRLDDAIKLAEKIRRYGGIFVLLIHPNILDHKLDFQIGFVKAMKPYAWFGSLRQFGDWWSARDRVSIDVESKRKKTRVVLDIPEAVNGLVVSVPESWRLLKTVPKSVQATKRRGGVILDSVQGKVEIFFIRE